MGEQGFGLHPPTVEQIARDLKQIHDLGAEVCVVIGGGNIFRGLQGVAQGLERSTADHMGMLATVMNALAMQSSLEGRGMETRVLSAIPMNEICEPFILRRAQRHLRRNRICIFAGGTGNPFFTTDTAAALRASEMKCDVIFKATKVDGIYTDDPVANAEAERFDTISFSEALERNLKIMDAAAITIARSANIPIIVFSVIQEGNLAEILLGQGVYTTIQ